MYIYTSIVHGKMGFVEDAGKVFLFSSESRLLQQYGWGLEAWIEENDYTKV